MSNPRLSPEMIEAHRKACEAQMRIALAASVREKMLAYAALDDNGAILSLNMWHSILPPFKTSGFRIEWFISYDFTTPHRKRDF